MSEVTMWECPACAFVFDAAHVTQATGEHDCPACAEVRLGKDNQRLQAELEKERTNHLRFIAEHNFDAFQRLQAEAAAMREALESSSESLQFAREKLGMGGPGDGPGRRADAPDDIGSDRALGSARAALSTTAGADLLERLRKAEEERDYFRGMHEACDEAALALLKSTEQERDALAERVKVLEEALNEVRPRCEQCGEPGTRYFRTEGDGLYWLCDSEAPDHGEEFYCGDEVEMPALRAALSKEGGGA